MAQVDNTFAKESSATVDWRKFDSGAGVLRALASGDVQIGSSPLAVTATQQLPIEAFLLASQLGKFKALVVKKNTGSPKDLIDKRIAVPFISTTHYSLLTAPKHWGIKPTEVQLVNLQPPAIIAAWQHGDIDSAYVWVVRKDFAQAHSDVMTAFAPSALEAQKPYIDNPEQWLKQPDNLSKLSRLSGVLEAQVSGLVRGNTYLTAQQQVEQLGKPVNKAIVDTANFLKEQDKVPQANADYSDFVTSRFGEPLAKQ